jgi:hypothetical protein
MTDNTFQIEISTDWLAAMGLVFRSYYVLIIGMVFSLLFFVFASQLQHYCQTGDTGDELLLMFL